MDRNSIAQFQGTLAAYNSNKGVNAPKPVLSFTAATAILESGLRMNARNSKGSATGWFQFVAGTANGLSKQAKGEDLITKGSDGSWDTGRNALLDNADLQFWLMFRILRSYWKRSGTTTFWHFMHGRGVGSYGHLMTLLNAYSLGNWHKGQGIQELTGCADRVVAYIQSHGPLLRARLGIHMAMNSMYGVRNTVYDDLNVAYVAQLGRSVYDKTPRKYGTPSDLRDASWQIAEGAQQRVGHWLQWYTNFIEATERGYM